MSQYSTQEVLLVLAGPSLRHLEECVYLEVIVMVILRTHCVRAKASRSQELLAPHLWVLVLTVAL